MTVTSEKIKRNLDEQEKFEGEEINVAQMRVVLPHLRTSSEVLAICNVRYIPKVAGGPGLLPPAGYHRFWSLQPFVIPMVKALTEFENSKKICDADASKDFSFKGVDLDAMEDPPTPEAIKMARELTVKIKERFLLEPKEIDVDAMGGVALYFDVGADNYWICVSNHLRATMININHQGPSFSFQTAEELDPWFAPIPLIAPKEVINGFSVGDRVRWDGSAPRRGVSAHDGVIESLCDPLQDGQARIKFEYEQGCYYVQLSSLVKR